MKNIFTYHITLKFGSSFQEKPNLLIVFKVFMGLKNMVLLVSFYMYSENMTLGMTCFFLVMLMANTVYCMLAHMYRREVTYLYVNEVIAKLFIRKGATSMESYILLNT